MVLKRKDWENELMATATARDTSYKIHLINKRLAEFLKKEVEKYPKEEDAPISTNKGNKEKR